MKQWKIWVLATSISGLTACSGDDVDRITFEEFTEQVSQSAENDAVDCGTVLIGESELSANTCVAEAFVNGQAFYAVYQLQGFDSSVGAALSGDSDGEVLEWEYDSNPAGGVPGSSSRVDSTVCVDAELSGSVDTGYADVFSCADEA